RPPRVAPPPPRPRGRRGARPPRAAPGAGAAGRFAVMTTIIPALRYPDARAAIAFLTSAFGFTEHAAYENDDGLVMHAELRLGDGWVMLGDQRAGSPDFPAGPATIYV